MCGWVCRLAGARLGPLWRDLEGLWQMEQGRTDVLIYFRICDCREEAEALPGKPSSDLARHGRHTRPELSGRKER